MPLTIRDTEALGKAIRAERKSLGLTQGDLAAASGVSLRFVSELERGRPTAGIGRVLHVLAMLGLRVELQGPMKTNQLEPSRNADGDHGWRS